MDDHPAVLAAVTDYLEQNGFRVTQARDGRDALAKIETQQPDVALVDLRMPRGSGVEVAREVSQRGWKTAVIVYTGFGEQSLLHEALDAGARGFVLKEAPLEDLVRAIDLVSKGATYVDPVLAGPLAQAVLGKESPVLTPRERDVLRLLAGGRSNEQIGRELHISPETVRTHVRKAMQKLNAETRTQAVASAIRQSLIA